MRSGNRLRTRIVWSTALISALAMAAMIGTIVLALNAVVSRTVDTTLGDRFDVLSSGVANDTNGPAATLETPGDAIDDTTWLFDSAGQQLEGPQAREYLQDEAERLRSVTTRTTSTTGERRFLAGPVSIGGPEKTSGVLVVSQSLDPYDTTRNLVLIGLGLLGLFVTVGTTAIAAWTVSRTLEPVEAMAALAEDWSAHDLDARFEDSPGGDEIARLGRTMNVLLDRVAGALRSEQRLTSELAHELRTPLSAIRGEAELALMNGPGDRSDDRLKAVVALADRMGETIRTLLDLARAPDRSGANSTTFEEVLSAVLAGRAADLPLTVGETPPEVDLGATTELVVRALAPLLDNAERHARTRIDIDCSVTARDASISVSDDGPGLVTDDIESLFVAGVRGEHSPGTGLGLALARRVARTLGGDVAVTSRSRPTTFTLTLPRH